jgi:TolB protein
MYRPLLPLFTRLALALASAAVVVFAGLHGFALAASRALPGGDTLAYVSERAGIDRIHIMDVARRLTYVLETGSDGDYTPAWSPDGSQLAFTSEVGYNYDIMVVDAQCAGVAAGCQREQRPLVNYRGENFSPMWSPDGRRIAFSSNFTGDTEIYVVDVACLRQPGSCIFEAENLTQHFYNDYRPVWSPDGEKIAFTSDRELRYDVYVMDADGTNLRRLTHDRADDYAPAWSPDGTRMVFTSDRTGNEDLFIMDADGRNARNLTNHPASDYRAAWSPDGRRLVFTSDRSGSEEIYVMDVASGVVERMTVNDATDYMPTWKPK